jgi:hypothetical protein
LKELNMMAIGSCTIDSHEPRSQKRESERGKRKREKRERIKGGGCE